MKPSRRLVKITMNFFEGQFDELRDLHPSLTPSESVRQLVDQHIKRVRARVPMVPVQEEIDLP